MTMKVLIDSEKCCGYGICAEICSSVFKLDSQGYVYIVDEAVDEADAPSAVEAAEACPESVITLTTD